MCVYSCKAHALFNIYFILAPKPTATAPAAKEQFLISPITGERIPASKMSDHMRYGV